MLTTDQRHPERSARRHERAQVHKHPNLAARQQTQAHDPLVYLVLLSYDCRRNTGSSGPPSRPSPPRPTSPSARPTIAPRTAGCWADPPSRNEAAIRGTETSTTFTRSPSSRSMPCVFAKSLIRMQTNLRVAEFRPPTEPSKMESSYLPCGGGNSSVWPGGGEVDERREEDAVNQTNGALTRQGRPAASLGEMASQRLRRGSRGSGGSWGHGRPARPMAHRCAPAGTSGSAGSGSGRERIGSASSTIPREESWASLIADYARPASYGWRSRPARPR